MKPKGESKYLDFSLGNYDDFPGEKVYSILLCNLRQNFKILH